MEHPERDLLVEVEENQQLLAGPWFADGGHKNAWLFSTKMRTLAE